MKSLTATDSQKAHSIHWLTPPYLIKALGPFDLDPCACSDRPRAFKCAEKEYVFEGEKREWKGLVWLNPPYNMDAYIWLEKMLKHGNGIALVFARTDTKRFQELVPKMDCIFFLAGRLSFYRPSGIKGDSAGAASILIGKGKLACQRIMKSGLKGFFVKPMMKL